MSGSATYRQVELEKPHGAPIAPAPSASVPSGVPRITLQIGKVCSLRACPHGFFLFGEGMCFKSEYGTASQGKAYADAYCASGEAFWGGKNTYEQRDRLQVRPVRFIVKAR